MKYLTFIRHSESYRQTPPPPALMQASSQVLAGKPAESLTEKLAAAIEGDLSSVRADQADWTMHRAIVLRAIRTLT